MMIGPAVMTWLVLSLPGILVYWYPPGPRVDYNGIYMCSANCAQELEYLRHHRVCPNLTTPSTTTPSTTTPSTTTPSTTPNTTTPSATTPSATTPSTTPNTTTLEPPPFISSAYKDAYNVETILVSTIRACPPGFNKSYACWNTHIGTYFNFTGVYLTTNVGMRVGIVIGFHIYGVKYDQTVLVALYRDTGAILSRVSYTCSTYPSCGYLVSTLYKTPWLGPGRYYVKTSHGAFFYVFAYLFALTCL